MAKTENVAHVTFRSNNRTEEMRGYDTSNISDGIVCFTWNKKKQALVFPLDTIEHVLFTEEETSNG